MGGGAAEAGKDTEACSTGKQNVTRASGKNRGRKREKTDDCASGPMSRKESETGGEVN